jgi:hypothetical protein
MTFKRLVKQREHVFDADDPLGEATLLWVFCLMIYITRYINTYRQFLKEEVNEIYSSIRVNDMQDARRFFPKLVGTTNKVWSCQTADIRCLLSNHTSSTDAQRGFPLFVWKFSYSMSGLNQWRQRSSEQRSKLGYVVSHLFYPLLLTRRHVLITLALHYVIQCFDSSYQFTTTFVHKPFNLPSLRSWRSLT